MTLAPARFDYTSTRLVHRQGTISYTMTDDSHVLVSAAALCCTLAITAGQILLEDMRRDQQAIMSARAMEGPATLDARAMLLSLFGSSGRHISMRGMFRDTTIPRFRAGLPFSMGKFHAWVDIDFWDNMRVDRRAFIHIVAMVEQYADGSGLQPAPDLTGAATGLYTWVDTVAVTLIKLASGAHNALVRPYPGDCMALVVAFLSAPPRMCRADSTSLAPHHTCTQPQPCACTLHSVPHQCPQ